MNYKFVAIISILSVITLVCAGCISNEVHVTITVRDKTNLDGIYAVVTGDGETMGVSSKEVYNSLEPGHKYTVVLGDTHFLSGRIGIVKILREVDV